MLHFVCKVNDYSINKDQKQAIFIDTQGKVSKKCHAPKWIQ